MVLSLPTWPAYSEDEVSAVSQVLQSGVGNYWFGSQGKAFEQEFAEYCGSAYGLAVANGTVALELSLRALGIGPGDEVITTPRSFIATANSILLCGAKPVFADVDLESQNITTETVEAVITTNTRAILVVHLAGWPSNMSGLKMLADKNNLYLIEDCAQAHGAVIDGGRVGSFGHAAAFSFCHDKIISTGGEGGMLVTNVEEVWAKAAAFRNHGRDPRKLNVNEEDHGHAYLHDYVGSNYRMTEMQAAIGRIQLTKLPLWLQERRENAELLLKKLSDIDSLRIATPKNNIEHAYYKFYVFIKKESLRKGWGRNRVISAIQAKGVSCVSGVCPEIYLEPLYKSVYPNKNARLPHAKELGETSLVFSVHPGIGENLMLQVAECIGEVMQIASNTNDI